MNYPIRYAAALALASFAVAANGQQQPLPDPANANAPVPPTIYKSPLGAPPAAAGASSPADNWKALNRTVAANDSMSMTMDMAEPKPATGPATPPSDPHAHHHPKEAK